MALLIEPALAAAPLRTLAGRADVALGTAAACIKDLTARGILLERKTDREITDRAALLALWLPAYTEGLRPRLPERRLQLRANDKAEMWNRLGAVLAKRGERWALTGADAAERRTHGFRYLRRPRSTPRPTSSTIATRKRRSTRSRPREAAT